LITKEHILIDGETVIAIQLELPKTSLIIVTTEHGYIMCGALDIQLLNDRLSDRYIIAARAVGVRSVTELLDAPLESVTDQARLIGIEPGMLGREAIVKMNKCEDIFNTM
jgi:uncharacterized protein YunC (DUF1805 family)